MLGDLNKPLNLSGSYEERTISEGSEFFARCPAPCLPHTDAGGRKAVSVLQSVGYRDAGCLC